jgi:hypothetical protein
MIASDGYNHSGRERVQAVPASTLIRIGFADLADAALLKAPV